MIRSLALSALALPLLFPSVAYAANVPVDSVLVEVGVNEAPETVETNVNSFPETVETGVNPAPETVETAVDAVPEVVEGATSYPPVTPPATVTSAPASSLVTLSPASADAPVSSANVETLAYTGAEIGLVGVVGLGLIASGVMLVRGTRTRTPSA